MYTRLPVVNRRRPQVPVRGAATTPVRKDSSKITKHYESPHYSDGFTLDMKKQEDLGLMPPK